MPRPIPVTIVLAYSNTGLLGRKNGDLPWNCPRDLKRFKDITLGIHADVVPGKALTPVVVMGRKTYDAIRKAQHTKGRKGWLLPGRKVAVVSRTLGDRNISDGVWSFSSYKKIADFVREQDSPFVTIAGGGEVYKAFLNPTGLESPIAGLFQAEKIETTVLYYPFVQSDYDVYLDKDTILTLDQPSKMGFRAEGSEYFRTEGVIQYLIRFSTLVRTG